MGQSEYRTPGQLIQHLLDKRGWTQRVLAIILQVDESGLNKAIAGTRPVDAELALKLSDVFGIPAEQFMDLQKSYELAQARIISKPDPDRASRALLFGDLPIGEMIKRGWISATDVRDVASVEKELIRFFGVRDVRDVELLPHAAKKTEVNISVNPAQIAWLYRVREIASEMLVPAYSNQALRTGVEKLRELLLAPEESRKAPRILAEAGVRFALVESLRSAKIDGVCFWLNDASPVIGLSMRYDRVDNFWFVLRHEIEHVLRGHGKVAIMLDAGLEGDRAGTAESLPEEERLANGAASEFCVPQRKLDSFIARKSPIFAEMDILGFSRTIGVHPGIVAGQLQHRTGRYDRFRNHLVKIRTFVAPSAVVDGWGDIAPVGL